MGYWCCWLATSALWLAWGTVLANPADLDLSFGTQGLALASVSDVGDDVVDAVLQPDGKIVVLGDAYFSDALGPDQIVLARFNANGSLDAEFGNGGLSTLTLGNGNNFPTQVALTTDGEIVVSAYSGDSQGIHGWLVKFRGDNGQLEQGFGNDGIVATPNDASQAYYGVLPQPDSSLLVAAWSSDLGSVILKYTATGVIDSSFANMGVATPPLDQTRRLLALEDGSIIVSGDVLTPFDGLYPALARMDGDGTFDPAFGDSGVAVADMGEDSDRTGAVSLQQNGAVLVAMCHDFVAPILQVARFNATGQLDETFGDQGIATAELGGDPSAYAIGVLPNGGFIVGGTDSDGGLMLVSFLSNGSLDMAFGFAGVSQIPGNGRTASVLIQPDGKVVEAGALSGANITGVEYTVVRHMGWADALFGNGFE